MTRIICQFGRKRCQKKRKYVDYKLFKEISKNILLYMSSRLSKIHSVHTYAMPWTVYFGWICRSGTIWLTLDSVTRFIASLYKENFKVFWIKLYHLLGELRNKLSYDFLFNLLANIWSEFQKYYFVWVFRCPDDAKRRMCTILHILKTCK